MVLDATPLICKGRSVEYGSCDVNVSILVHHSTIVTLIYWPPHPPGVSGGGVAMADVLLPRQRFGDLGESEGVFDELSTDGYRSLLTLANSAMASSGVGSAHGSWRSTSSGG